MIRGIEKQGGELEFSYSSFSQSTVYNFLALVYTESHDDELLKVKLTLEELLDLARFLKWDGKNMISGQVNPDQKVCLFIDIDRFLIKSILHQQCKIISYSK